MTDPARAIRVATLTGPYDFVQAIAFSPRDGLLAAVTYQGTVLVFSLADPARPAITARISGIMADALYPTVGSSIPIPATCAARPGTPLAGVSHGRVARTITGSM